PLSSFFQRSAAPRALHSFPTRRSSDLPLAGYRLELASLSVGRAPLLAHRLPRLAPALGQGLDVVLHGVVADTCPAFSDGLASGRSEEHTSELQSRENLVCRLLLEKKNR